MPSNTLVDSLRQTGFHLVLLNNLPTLSRNTSQRSPKQCERLRCTLIIRINSLHSIVEFL